MNRTGSACRLVLVALAPLLAASVAAAQQGTITGTITDQESGQPLASAQVVVVGTNIGTITGIEGTYTLRGVPAGTVNIRALSIGYAEQTQQVTLQAGGTATANFELRPMAISMAPMVVTATG